MLWQLLRAYIVQAWPFAIGHALLMVYLFQKRAVILREADALRRFRPKQTVARSPAERIFEDYIAESEQWLPRGVLAPMSDYTARLEAWLGTQVGNARGAVNLLLVIGIAGTFYALFSFAGDASKLSSQKDVARSLTSALSYAFPVGFIGLMLNLIGHLVVSDAEGKLRDGMQAATSAALRFTRELAVSAKTPVDQLTEALEPLRRLDQSVGQALVSVLEQFTSGLFREQMQALEKALSEVRGAVQELGGPIQQLKTSIETMSPTLERVGELQRNAAENLQSLATAGNSLARVPAELTAELTSGMERFAGAIRRTEESFQAALDGLREASGAGWNQAVETLRQSFANQAAGDIRRIGDASEQALQKLGAAASKLDQNADGMKAVVRELFRGAEEAIRERLVELHTVLTEQYPEALDRLRATIDSTWRAHNTFQKTLEQMESVETRWREIHAQAEQMIERMSRGPMGTMSADVHSTVEHLQAIRSRVAPDRKRSWPQQFRIRVKKFGNWWVR